MQRVDDVRNPRQLAFGLTLLACGLLAFTLSACATVVTGTTETISITSEPSGAVVSVLPTGQSVTSPATLELSKKNSYLLRVILDCHEEARVRVDNGVHPLMWGSILIGGVVGLVIDVSSGGGFDLEPDVIHFELKRLPECPRDVTNSEGGRLTHGATPANVEPREGRAEDVEN
jgi:hypothetical protein